MSQYANQRCLVFDESGNLGHSGRYFVIACIDTNSYKELYNIIKRKMGRARILFPELASLHAHEIKAKDAYPSVKYHIMECIASKELSISYIVLDLKHIEPRLLDDKNIMYNYASKLLISNLITHNDETNTVNILFDNKTTKIASTNSLKDYVTIHILYEKNMNVNINFEYKDSDAKDAYVIQAADYVANAIYSFYEYGNDEYYKVINPKIKHVIKFPIKDFGK